MTTLTDEELDRGPDAALLASHVGPVFVTDNGVITYVLLSIEAYEALVGPSGPTETIT